MKRTITRALLLTLAAALPFVAGCTNKQGETESPVFLTTDFGTTVPLQFNIAPGAPLQLPTMILTSHAKNSSVTDPQGFQTVQVTSYVVHFTRLDGGTKVPPDETFAAGGTVPFKGTLAMSNFPVITPAASQQSPFDQLLPFNGGIDQETGQPLIHLGITVTFYGETVAGTRVSSAPATLGIFVLYSAQ